MLYLLMKARVREGIINFFQQPHSLFIYPVSHQLTEQLPNHFEEFQSSCVNLKREFFYSKGIFKVINYLIFWFIF